MATSSVDFAPGRLRYGTESRMGVIYKRQSTRRDGSAGAIQYLKADIMDWVDELVVADSLWAFVASPDDPAEQSAPVPILVTDDPTAYAVVYTLGANNELLSKTRTIGASELYGTTRAPFYL